MADMDPTKPFLTEDLLKLRVEQRCFLAGLPNWIIERLPPVGPIVPPGLPFHQARAEAAVRRFVSETMGQHEDALALLSWGVKANEAIEVVEYLKRWANEVLSSREAAMAPSPTQEAYQYFSQRLRDTYRTAIDEAEFRQIAPALAIIVPALDVADALAGDGYRDPRLPRVSDSAPQS